HRALERGGPAGPAPGRAARLPRRWSRASDRLYVDGARSPLRSDGYLSHPVPPASRSGGAPTTRRRRGHGALTWLSRWTPAPDEHVGHQDITGAFTHGTGCGRLRLMYPRLKLGRVPGATAEFAPGTIGYYRRPLQKVPSGRFSSPPSRTGL